MRTSARGAAKGRVHTTYYGDGGVRARGRMLGGAMHGGWEFFRKDGSLMRSGSFDRGDQVGKWSTFTASGRVVKVTEMGAGRAAKAGSRPVRLLSGGNPQIAKGDGPAAVRAYIDAMPGWKRGVGRTLDALVVRALGASTNGRRRGPEAALRKAVRWNTPFYGIDDRGWFLGFHCIAKYVKVAFLNGAHLTPLPPVASKLPSTRYLHVHEGDAIDEAQFVRWVKQAAARPGEPLF